MDKLNKIEEAINKVLERVIALVLAFLSKLIPVNLKNNFLRLKANFKTWVNSKKIAASHRAQSIKKKSLEKKEKISTFPLKNTIRTFIDKVRDFLLKTPLKSYTLKLSSWLAPKYKNLESMLESIAPSHYGIAFGAVFMITTGVFGIYITSNDILNKEFPYRAPASVQEYDYRPDYLQYKQKSLKVFNIKIPVFREDLGRVKTITVDFNIRTSTRFARHFLEQYQYKLRDYFLSSAEQTISDFVLEEEGKEVVKGFIQKEINFFLKNERVEGEVEDVKILYVIGT